MFKGIDFYSDTVTRPGAAMRKAMCEAEVGDEQKGEDPTTIRLEEKAAELLGHTSALFFPSATMANEVAIRAMCEPGDELFGTENCHLFFAEAGGPAIHAAVMCRALKTANGIFTGADLEANYRYAKGSHYPVSKMVSVENTTNMGGGFAWSLSQIDSVITTAKKLDLKTHMDGSRFMNACVSAGYLPKVVGAKFDMVTLCLSKGLGCPAGAILAFDKSRWTQIRRLKQLMGGALRQSGILAAAGIYALENNIERLREDHENATLLAQGLAKGIDGIEVENVNPSSNMVFFRWKSARMTDEQFLTECTRKGLRFSHVDSHRFRAVTHLDIKRSDIEPALSIVRTICGAH